MPTGRCRLLTDARARACEVLMLILGLKSPCSKDTQPLARLGFLFGLWPTENPALCWLNSGAGPLEFQALARQHPATERIGRNRVIKTSAYDEKRANAGGVPTFLATFLRRIWRENIAFSPGNSFFKDFTNGVNLTTTEVRGHYEN